MTITLTIIALILFFLSIYFVNRMLYWKDAAEEVEEMNFNHRRIHGALMNYAQDLANKNKQLKADNQELQLKLEKAMQDYWSKP